MRTPVLLALALALAACKQSPPGRCGSDGDCAAGQQCAGGVCVRFDTDHQLGSRCIRNGDCVSWGVCAAGVCSLAPGACVDGTACDPAWQVCTNHACVAAPGFCAGNAGCDTSWQECSAAHACVAAPGHCADVSGCDVSWQECSAAHACVAAPGFCTASADCLVWEVCNASHLCENGPGYCATGAECAGWQTCSALHACVVGPGYCAAAGDCESWQDCGADHRCATKVGRCASTNDCQVWDLCDATHTCVHQAGYCANDLDCTAPETCSVYHACSNQTTGRLQWLKRIGSDDPAAMAEQNTYAYQIACLGGGDLVANVFSRGPVDPGDGVLRSGHIIVSFASADGAVQWAFTVSSNPEIEPAPGGDFVMVGTGAGDDLGGGPLPQNWIARLAADRTIRWQGARPADPMGATAVAVSSTGEIALAGTSWTGSGSSLVWWSVVTKLDPTGLTSVWSVRPLDDAPGGITKAAFTPAGDVVIAATRNGIANGSTARAISVVLLDGATGARLWKREYGTNALGNPTLPAVPHSLAVGADGTITLAGHVGRDMSFGGSLLDINYGDEAFVLKLAANGDYLWHVQAKESVDYAFETWASGAQLPDGTVYLEAEYARTVDVGGTVVGTPETFGAMLVRIDPSGVVSSVSTYPLSWLYEHDPFGGVDQGMVEMCAGNGHLGWLEHRHGRRVIEGVPSMSGKVVDAFVGKLGP